MRVSRKKMINVTCSEGVRKRVDQFLSIQYQAWKKTQQPNKNNLGIFTCGTQSSNTLIMDYVRFIYREYGIPDPLANQQNEHHFITGKPTIQHQTPKRDTITKQNYNTSQSNKIRDQIQTVSKPAFILQEPELHESNIMEQATLKKTSLQLSQTAPKKALFNSRESTQHRRQNSYQIDRSSIGLQDGVITRRLDQSQNAPISGRNGPRNSQPIRQIMSVQLHEHERNGSSQFDTPAYTTPTNKKPTQQSFFKYSKRVILQQQSKRQKQTPSCPVPESYRYCIACQNAVLDANIECHQKSCSEFKKVYQFDLQGILMYLHQKIQGFKIKVKNYTQTLSTEDCEKIRNFCGKMDGQCQEIFKSGKVTKEYIRNYDEAIKIGRRWSLTTEQINKLRWFVKIRQEIKKKFNV